MNRTDQSLAEMRRTLELDPLSAVHVALGDPERALDLLDRAYEEHSHWLVFLAVDPQFDTLRQEPRFHDLLRRVGLAHLT